MSKRNKVICVEDFWECKDCGRDNIEDDWCPCPRGNCQAKIVGTIETHIIRNEPNENQILGQSTII